MPTPTTLIQHSIGSTRVIRQEKEIKGIQIGKEGKLSLVTTFYIQKTLKTPPKIINEYIKLQGTKLIYKNLLYCHALTINLQRKTIKKTIPFKIATIPKNTYNQGGKRPVC